MSQPVTQPCAFVMEWHPAGPVMCVATSMPYSTFCPAHQGSWLDKQTKAAKAEKLTRLTAKQRRAKLDRDVLPWADAWPSPEKHD